MALHRQLKDSYVKSQYLLTRHGPAYAFHALFSRPRLASPEVLDSLLSSGAKLPRWLGQKVVQAYTSSSNSREYGSDWARAPKLRSISFAPFRALNTSSAHRCHLLDDFQSPSLLSIRRHPQRALPNGGLLQRQGRRRDVRALGQPNLSIIAASQMEQN